MKKKLLFTTIAAAGMIFARAQDATTIADPLATSAASESADDFSPANHLTGD